MLKEISELELNGYGPLLFKIMSNESDLGIAVIDVDGHFVYYNRTMAEIEGLQSEDMIGKHVFDMFPSYNKQNSTIFKCMRTKEPIYDDMQRYINFKGKKITSVVTDLPIIVDGEIKGVIEVVRDVERIKRLYESVHALLEDVDVAGRNNKIRHDAYYSFDNFLTCNKEMQSLIQRVKRVSPFGSNTLIYGETGTGKEIFAQSIHNHGPRKKGPFISQNCAAIPENLMESILFGTEIGSFTGAVDMTGLFEQADGGTLLLDELSSLPINLQAKLLRVLQEGRVKRIGGTEEKTIDVQVIAIVNESPQLLMKEGRLREDLYFRLNAMSIYISPLRDRPEDIALLLDHFFDEYASKFKLSKPKLTKEALEFFMEYEWKGNVREVMNVVEYILINKDSEKEVTIDHFPHYLRGHSIDTSTAESSVKGYADVIDSHEKTIITKALQDNNWNVSRTARDLDIKRQTLHNKMKKLNIRRPI